MPDRVISFKGSMIRAILSGHKTVTRRVLPVPDGSPDVTRYGWSRDEARDRLAGASVQFRDGTLQRLPFWAGDRVAVREAVRAEADDRAFSRVRYLADDAFLPIAQTQEAADRWLELFHYRKAPKNRLKGLGHDVPPMHAPLWTSRLTLEVTDVRVERLHEITDEQAIREGATSIRRPWGLRHGVEGAVPHEHPSARLAFRDLWDQINGWTARRWSLNPLVIAIEFKALPINIANLPWCPRATAARLTPTAARALQMPSGQGAYSGATYTLLRDLDLIDDHYEWTDRAEQVRRQLKLTGRY